MINGRLSSQAILQQVASSYGITLPRKADCIEWIGDCMELIGYHTGFINKYELIPVINFTIEKPVDFQSFNKLMLPSGEILAKGKARQPIETSQSDFVSDVFSLIEAKEFLKCASEDEFAELDTIEPNCTRQEYLKRLNEQIQKRLPLINTGRVSDSFYFYDEESCWKTNYEGKVVLFYKAFPLDDEGYPLVIDEINYKMALRWYVLQCLMQTGMKHPLLKYEDVFQFAETYIHRASNYGAKFSKEQKEAFASRWATAIQDRPGFYEN